MKVTEIKMVSIVPSEGMELAKRINDTEVFSTEVFCDETDAPNWTEVTEEYATATKARQVEDLIQLGNEETNEYKDADFS